MTKQRTALLLMAALLTAVVAHPIAAQTNDLGLWTSVEGSTKLAPGLGMSIEAEYRLRDNISHADRTSLGVSFSYKNKTVLPWLKVDAGFSFIYKNNQEERTIKYETDDEGNETDTPKHCNIDAAYWGPKHRATASLSGSWKVGRMKIGVRERYQYTYRVAQTVDRQKVAYAIDNFDDWFFNGADPVYVLDWEDVEQKTADKKAKYDNKLRSRVSASYNIKHCKFEPFAEVEIYNDLDNRMVVDKIRYTIGTDYKLTKTMALSAYYRYQDHSTEDEAGGHVIGVGYSFEF